MRLGIYQYPQKSFCACELKVWVGRRPVLQCLADEAWSQCPGRCIRFMTTTDKWRWLLSARYTTDAIPVLRATIRPEAPVAVDRLAGFRLITPAEGSLVVVGSTAVADATPGEDGTSTAELKVVRAAITFQSSITETVTCGQSEAEALRSDHEGATTVSLHHRHNSLLVCSFMLWMTFVMCDNAHFVTVFYRHVLTLILQYASVN